MAIRVEIAGSEIQQGAAEDWVLVTPRTIRIARLQESSETGVGTIDAGLLIRFKHVCPVTRAIGVLLVVR